MQPEYDYGDKVRLIRRGAIGFVHDVGTYLQEQLIYRVHFIDAQRTVGCRGEELIDGNRDWLENRFEFRDRVLANRDIVVNGELIAGLGDEGEIVKVVRESDTRFHYHVRFYQRTFQMPEFVLAVSNRDATGTSV